jgi:hypothetical protein
MGEVDRHKEKRPGRHWPNLLVTNRKSGVVKITLGRHRNGSIDLAQPQKERGSVVIGTQGSSRSRRWPRAVAPWPPCHWPQRWRHENE